MIKNVVLRLRRKLSRQNGNLSCFSKTLKTRSSTAKQTDGVVPNIRRYWLSRYTRHSKSYSSSATSFSSNRSSSTEDGVETESESCCSGSESGDGAEADIEDFNDHFRNLSISRSTNSDHCLPRKKTSEKNNRGSRELTDDREDDDLVSDSDFAERIPRQDKLDTDTTFSPEHERDSFGRNNFTLFTDLTEATDEGAVGDIEDCIDSDSSEKNCNYSKYYLKVYANWRSEQDGVPLVFENS